MPNNVQAEVLLHEILHTVFHASNLNYLLTLRDKWTDDLLEEVFVQQFGTGLATVIKDNPQLIKYLQGALK